MIKFKCMILTTDRYFPWNGTNIDKPDRIWGNLSSETGIPFLIYSEKGRIIEGAELVAPKMSIRFVYYFISILVKSWVYGSRKDKRLFLGKSPKAIFKEYRFKDLIDKQCFNDLFRWHLAYATLRCYFNRNPLDMLIFHGEFNRWGIAVSWACRDAGVIPVAHQHGLYGPEYKQYKNLEKIKDYIAKALLLASQNQYDIFLNLPLKTYVAGSRRLSFNDNNYTNIKDKEFDYLVIPSGDDDRFFQDEIKKSSAALNVKPHPLRMEGWEGENIIIVDGDIETLILKTKKIIATAGFSLIYAIKHRVPIILLDCAASRGNRFIVKSDLPKSLEEAIRSGYQLIIEDLDYYYHECNREEYLKILEEVYELGTS